MRPKKRDAMRPKKRDAMRPKKRDAAGVRPAECFAASPYSGQELPYGRKRGMLQGCSLRSVSQYPHILARNCHTAEKEGCCEGAACGVFRSIPIFWLGTAIRPKKRDAARVQPAECFAASPYSG